MNASDAVQLRGQDSIGESPGNRLPAWFPGRPGPASSVRCCSLQHSWPRKRSAAASTTRWRSRSARWRRGPMAGFSRSTSSCSACSRSPLRSGYTVACGATRAGIAGPALLLVSGIGLLLAAAFPLSEDAAGVILRPVGHIVGGSTFFLGSALGLIVVSRRLARDPRWQGISTYTLLAGIVALVLRRGRRRTWWCRTLLRCTTGPACTSG